jgi:hypothetical protein
LQARDGDVLREAVLPCKQALRVRLPTSPPRRISTEVVLTVGIGADPVRLRNAAPCEHGRMVRHWSSKPATRVRSALLALLSRARDVSAACLSATQGDPVRLRAGAPDLQLWEHGALQTRQGADRNRSTSPGKRFGRRFPLPLRTAGALLKRTGWVRSPPEAPDRVRIQVSSCPVSAGGTGGLATNEAGGGSTPPRDSTPSPAALAATLRTSHDAVRLCARALSSEHGAMVAHYFHTVGIGRFEYGARFQSRRRRAAGALS